MTHLLRHALNNAPPLSGESFGGMALTVLGMLLAAFGYLSPVGGAISQEIIDVLAIANALRVAVLPRSLSDISQPVQGTK